MSGLISGLAGRLKASGGAALVFSKSPLSGAVARSVEARIDDGVSIADASGVDLTGAADSTTATQTYLNSIGLAGGTVRVPNGAKLRLLGNLTIPANVHFIGPHRFTGTPGSNASAPYGQLGGAILIGSTATISLASGASIGGFYIYRDGMTFPAANASAFAGTALTPAGDDVSIVGNMILGFAKAVYSSGVQRPRIEQNLIDCQAGIEVTNCLDISHIEHNHCWPFATIANGGDTPQRTGAAFWVHDTADMTYLVRNFSYGYAYGHKIGNVFAVRVIGGECDNELSSSSGDTGFYTYGTCNELMLDGCHSDSNNYNFDFQHTAGTVFGGSISAGQAHTDHVRIGVGASVSFGVVSVAGTASNVCIEMQSGVGPVSIGTVIASENTPANCYSFTTTDQPNIRIGYTALNGVATADNLGKGSAGYPSVKMVQGGRSGLFQDTDGTVGTIVNGVQQVRVAPQAGAVNVIELRGGATGNPVDIFAAGTDTNIALRLDGQGTGGVLLGASSSTPVGFFGGPPSTKQTVTGAKGSNAALASLIAALVAVGLITDSTTA